ncbi:MAG: Holliday junction resolvase [Thermoplasmata archaeon]|nr:Holliday junction resolvase [Thermoplasmata archaeon]
MSIYERELKEIFSGNKKIIDRVIKSCNNEEREKYYKIIDKPFIVIRAAGSLGIADIVAMRGDISFIVEIKVRKEDEILFSHEGGRMQNKAIEMKEKCSQTKILPIFAYRLKGIRGDAWRVFTMDMENLEGKSKKINKILPKLELSPNKNYIMRWKKGMKLSDFIDII